MLFSVPLIALLGAAACPGPPNISVHSCIYCLWRFRTKGMSKIKCQCKCILMRLKKPSVILSLIS